MGVVLHVGLSYMMDPEDNGIYTSTIYTMPVDAWILCIFIVVYTFPTF